MAGLIVYGTWDYDGARTNPPPRENNDDEAEGDFYVTVIDRASNAGHVNRIGALLGPYDTLGEAEANVDRGRKLAGQANRWAYFYGYGVTKFKRGAVKRTIFGR